MKIFVTGGNGFLGKSLCKKLIEIGYEVIAPTSKECNLFNYSNLEKFNSESFDIIYHLAAWTQAGDFCLKHPGEQWINNQKINTNILEWWFNSNKKSKLIFMGTSCSYSPGIDMIEDNYMDGEPIDSLYTYAMTKRMLLQGARALEKQFNMNWLCFVPSTLYGPDYHTDGRQMHFIFDLIRKIIRAKEYGEEVVLWGNGEQKREIVHVDDFIESSLKLSNKYSNEIINLGYGEEFSIKFFANQICKVVDYDFKKIKFDTSKYVGAKSKCLNIDKVSNYLPKYKDNLTSTFAGMSKTIDWFYENKAY